MDPQRANVNNGHTEVLIKLAALETEVGHLVSDLGQIREDLRAGAKEMAGVQKKISETAGVRRWMLVAVGAIFPIALAGLVNAIQMHSSIEQLERAMVEHTSGGGHRETHAAIESLRAQMFQWTTQQLSHESDQDSSIRALVNRIDSVESRAGGRNR